MWTAAPTTAAMPRIATTACTPMGRITCGVPRSAAPSWANAGGTRDTDWYQFTLTAAEAGQGHADVGIPRHWSECCSRWTIAVTFRYCWSPRLANAYSSGCSVRDGPLPTLDPGTYVVWVGPGDSELRRSTTVSSALIRGIDYDLHLVCDPPVVCTAPTYWQDYHNSPSASSAAISTYRPDRRYRYKIGGQLQADRLRHHHACLLVGYHQQLQRNRLHSVHHDNCQLQRGLPPG